jgi:hypothetical protein
LLTQFPLPGRIFELAFTLSTIPPDQLPAAALTNPIPSPSNDPYDVNDPVTPNPAPRQQQRPLRRTHIAATSPGISPPPRVRFAEQQARSARPTHALDDEFTSTTTPLVPSSQEVSPEAERRPHRALRISRNTASAILYTLEEALRHPHPFTPDPVEENASMSDLVGGVPSASAGNGRGGSRRQAPPANTGSPGIKGPIDIMRERNAREARRKAEQEQKEAQQRSRAEEEARLIEEEKRKSAEKRAAAAAGGAGQNRSGEGGQRGSGGTTGQRISDNSQRSDRRSGDRNTSGRQPDAPLQGVGRGGTAVGGGEAATSRPRPTQSQQQPRPVPSENTRTRPAAADAGPSGAGQSSSQQQGGSGGNPTRSSFPHAFERWETLSAHWEGLTSFWIRRLEDNSNEINRDPLSQQLSRQVTDLSAAGANLFHAVVELQRLRASSERKFQRWFFETRAEQERAQEIQAGLQENLENERSERASAIEEAIAREREKSNVDKQLAEMKRELQISKEEARRAWEELGRREQEERERTASLREGQPTLVGGVQVVPMMQGVPSRHGSARDRPPTREGPYTGGAVQQAEGPADSDAAYQEYARAQRDPVDPFVETQPRTPTGRQAVPTSLSQHPAFTNSQEYSQAPAVQPASTSAFYQQRQGTSLHPTEQDPAYGASVPSESALSDEEYEIDSQGHFILDAHGNKIRYRGPLSDPGSDEDDAQAEREREIANLQRYGQVSGFEYGSGATTTAGRVATSHPTIGEPVDYSGQTYGSGPAEWAAVPRHHHPTRLSDVLEEDERSRTSTSQVSRTRGD